MMKTSLSDKSLPEVLIPRLRQFQSELKAELNSLLRWWDQEITDTQYGGYYGRIDGHGQLHPKAHKGIILNSRILWSYSAIAQATEGSLAYRQAVRSASYLLEHFWDRQEGGLYWMLDHQGELLDGRKQIYAQAFGIYAFSEYYQVSKETWALEKAMELFWLMETYSADKKEGGYFEAFSQSWGQLEDVRLSDKDANEAKTMNTHLHILEAYTNLYRIGQDQTVKLALETLIQCFLDRFIDPETGHLCLFFDENWQAKSTEISFGHDIECSWLLWEAAEVAGMTEQLSQLKVLVLKQVDSTLTRGLAASGGLWNEMSPNGHIDTDHHWWPQAEAMVGCWNAWELTGNSAYLETTIRIWNFIKQYLKDERGGEWHWMVNEAGAVQRQEDKAGPWKAPYHNARMCMEILRRMTTDRYKRSHAVG